METMKQLSNVQYLRVIALMEQGVDFETLSNEMNMSIHECIIHCTEWEQFQNLCN